MSRYVTRRLLQLLPTLAVILVLTFVLIHAAPGDPVVTLAGEHGDEAYYSFMRERFGLDRPVHVRLAVYAGRVAQGDLGSSWVQGRPALEIVLERAPATLLLAGTSLSIALLLGVGIGTLSAWRRGGRADTALTLGVLTVYSAPTFWIGQIAVLSLAAGLGWFPVEGLRSADAAAAGVARLADLLHHLALPALVLAAHETALIARLTRSGVARELEQDHVRTARAMGLRERNVLFAHALPGALLPVLTVVGGRLGQILAGAVIVEVVFGWPGLGRLMLTSLQTRDAPVLLTLFLLSSIAVVVANLVTDLLYAALDPRVRYR